MRGVTRRRAAVTSTVVIILGVIGAWNERQSLADGAIASALLSRGVKASYRIADIGLRWERLENIVIGDPRNPDLTADWAGVRVAPTLGGITATTIRAGGVRLRGRLVDGKISFGAIDRLLPAPTTGPFSLPDLTVDVSDARIALNTAYGNIGARIDGKGNLANGFKGKLAAIAQSFDTGGCQAERATLYVDLSIVNRSPGVKGPVRADSIRCGTTRFTKPAMKLDVALGQALDSWQGNTAIDLKSFSSGANGFQAITGTVEFSGNVRETKGNARIAAKSASLPSVHANGLSLNGRFGLRGADMDGRATVAAARAVIDPRYAAQLRSVATSAGGTPVAPLLTKLAVAIGDAGKALSLSANLAMRVANGQASAILTTADITSAQGMRAHVGGGQGIGFGAAGVFADTQATLVGGGFPTVAATFRRTTDGLTSGVARMAPYAASNAALSLTPVQFSIDRFGAARVQTMGALDGPIGNGRVNGLRVPVTLTVGRGNIQINPGCSAVSFQALAVSGLVLSPASLRLCAPAGGLFSVMAGRVGGGATVSTPRLTGTLGDRPIEIGATQAQVALTGDRFAVGKLGVKLGSVDHMTRLDVGQLDGGFAGGAIAGKFVELSGQIANVPLLIDAGAGNWGLNDGQLTLDGSARVSDEANPVRFNTLAAEDVKLSLVNGKIAMTGMLREPTTHTDVSSVTIAHDLGTSVGRADLNVTGLKFGTALQPEKLTPLTLGVVANVEGSLAGKGEILWSSAGVTSTGRFSTRGLDFAAAFGPVTGLSGEIVFTDLLGMVTAPGQTVSLGIVNPGIPVPDGVVTYHLAANQRIVVEGGRWPFAGGALTLDPTTLDMGVSKERRLTFRVESLDAAKFIQKLEFEDLSATGTFDGAMPMIFDDAGGRIVGGKISARQGGGTLSYVGDVSNAKMNVFAKLAFDALKSISYNNLSVEMDGALDGEIISKVNFRGVNEAPTTQKRGYFARQFSNLPFIFNITIRAPFRSLLTTARTFQDPSALLRSLPLQVIPDPVPPQVIQPPESEKRP
ncbi:hypothetical protein BH09PSE3_BH09PSE3_24300 [soil metagenome]